MDAILYASLGEAEPYLINDGRIATWAGLYDRAVGAIKTSNDGKKYPNIQLAVTAR
jgi:hypothetical protein